ncbi:DUF3775 domain-containing protein [uncultured Paracoccus sp.]|uniref:DUF3775 domain-containing protein n=1 Tax=uncultured Paracoccus sp. TaxID=189685 RepID=UPI0025F78015|nr:DUF3775 domain-containing protein [uncultured Paracoccus sp.]
MIDITPDKVAQVIVLAREYQSGIDAWAHQGSRRKQHGNRTELHDFIEAMDDDEKASLVAVMWIGRDTFDASEIAEAIATARSQSHTPTEDYLMADPQLADYLEAGLEALGISPEDETEAIQRPV